MTLQITWYLLIVLLLAGYAILDGFDFGVGFWHLFSKNEQEKRININSIGPVWDGNEVWLLTGGGALFAAFPPVYATVFSGFYIAMILLLVALISRAISIEFRHQVDSPGWKRFWDIIFGLGSILPPILFGVVLGNLIKGLRIDETGFYVGTFLELLNPFSILAGLTTLALFTCHGAIYLSMKTDGEYHERVKSRAKKSWYVSFVLLTAFVLWTIIGHSYIVLNYMNSPFLTSVPIFALVTLGCVRANLKDNKIGVAFINSSLAIGALAFTIGLGIFPYLVLSVPDTAFSLSAYNSSSSQKTLSIMLIIALIGMPLVITYTIYVYRVFRGKVNLEDMHY